MLSLASCEVSTLVFSPLSFLLNFCFSNCMREGLSIFYPLVIRYASFTYLEIAGAFELCCDSLFSDWILGISGTLIDRPTLLFSLLVFCCCLNAVYLKVLCRRLNWVLSKILCFRLRSSSCLYLSKLTFVFRYPSKSASVKTGSQSEYYDFTVVSGVTSSEIR